jgi:hypothetical protein
VGAPHGTDAPPFAVTRIEHVLLLVGELEKASFAACRKR